MVKNICITDLCVRRGHRLVVFNLTAKIDQGGAFIVTGPNGAGKTTFLRAVAGFIQPEKGAIHFEGIDDDASSAEFCHFISLKDAVKSTLTVRENVEFWAKFFANPHMSAPSAIDAIGLSAISDAAAGYLSSGQKRRLALSRLLIARRPVWVLDEPTTALDKAGVALVEDLIRQHLSDGGIAIIATHQQLDIPSQTIIEMAGTHATAGFSEGLQGDAV